MIQRRRHIKSLFEKYKFRWILIIGLFLVWLLSLPKPLFNDPTATLVQSNEGVMLGARIADDGQWRFPEIDSVPYRFEQSILQFEDAYFYSHPGFNPVSMSKAIWQNMTTDKRRGGSTISQQVIRLSRKNRSRNYSEKFVELWKATRLEASYSKEEILKLYASHAPFGGNVVGLDAAAWRYFGIPAHLLSWGQSAALAVLPNAPSLIFPGKNEQILKLKRDALLLKLFENEIIDSTTYELALEERLPGKPFALPNIAAHLSEKIKKTHRGEKVITTIKYPLQQKMNRLVSEHHYQLKQNEINNLAILVLDVNTREVLAYVGNAPTTREHNNYVDIIDKPRSTGSILKPFLYAAALDGGDILPKSLVADIPIVVNGYSPKNFDNEYSGAVPANEALSRSLNVPAVQLLRKYGLRRFHHKLKDMNFDGINQPADYYGLSLILGGAESSLWEITNAYAGMASTLNYFNTTSSEYRASEFTNPTFVKNELVQLGETKATAQVLDAGSIYATFEALQNVHRPMGEENWEYYNSSQSIAWKTGTSYGFKDAWAVGVTPQYAIGIWVGNADGEGRPGLTGIQAAAPVLFDVLSELPKTDWFDVPYDELVSATLCEKSGALAGVFCNAVVSEYIPKNGMKSHPCSYHQKVFLTTTETQRVNSSCYPLEDMVQKNWFVLPPIQEYYYANLHPEYNSLPPFKEDCMRNGESLMQFIFPKKNETILLSRDFDTAVNEVVFKLAHRIPESKIYWYLNQTFLGVTDTFHELAVQPIPGNYVLTAVDEEGNEVRQQIEIGTASI